jgi:hypothetical protein
MFPLLVSEWVRGTIKKMCAAEPAQDGVEKKIKVYLVQTARSFLAHPWLLTHQFFQYYQLAKL